MEVSDFTNKTLFKHGYNGLAIKIFEKSFFLQIYGLKMTALFIKAKKYRVIMHIIHYLEFERKFLINLCNIYLNTGCICDNTYI